MELLVKCTIRNGPAKSVEELPLIHHLIQLRVPVFIVYLAAKVYPEQVRLRDQKGRIPLHWAAIQNNKDSQEGCDVRFNDCFKFNVEGIRPVEVLFDCLPEGATYFDREGCLPLHLLLNLEYESYTDNQWTRRCVVALAKQAPQGLIRRTRLDFMLPFMTAASLHDCHTVSARYKGEEQNMLLRKQDLCYELLRANPSVVASGISESAQEKYLKRRLTEAHSEIEGLKQRQNALLNEIARLEQGARGDTTVTSDTRNPKRLCR